MIVVMSDDEKPEVTVFFNPSCSTCRTTRDLLVERGIDADYIRYLEDTPSRRELEDVLRRLGSEDPRTMMRTSEPVYQELGLAEAGPNALLDAMVENPILIQRPIVIRGDRAVIGRPPERINELLD